MGDSASSEDGRKRRTSDAASFLKPIIVSVVFAAVFTFLTINAIYVTPIEFIPQSQGGIAAAAANAIILTTLPFIGALLLLVILRNKKRLLLNIFIGTAFLLAGFTIFSIILASAMLVAFPTLQGETIFLIAIPVSLALNIVFVAVILSARAPQTAKNIVAVTYGGGIGTLLGTALPLWTGLLMVMGISIYDIYSVNRGPIKEIVKVSKEQQTVIPGLSYMTNDWEIGLGDLGIYSMLVSLAETQFGSIACLASIVGIIIGSLLTLQLLKKREFLPGLPITSLIGAIPIVIYMILSI